MPEPEEIAPAPAAVRRAHADAFLSGWTTEGGPRSWHLPQDRDQATVGRATDADVHVDGDSQVSRLHARLERVAGQWSIVDDGLSRNGDPGERQAGHPTGPAARPRPDHRRRDPPGLLRARADRHRPDRGRRRGAAAAQPHRAQLGVLRALCRPCLAGGPYTAPASNQEIARELSLSLDGVKTHLRTLFGKFGIGDLPQNQKRARLSSSRSVGAWSARAPEHSQRGLRER